MKQIRVSDVHYQMAIERARKRKMKVEDYMESLIKEDYNRK